MSSCSTAPDIPATMASQLSASMKRFCSYTTAHGLGRFSEQSSLVGKCIWVAFLLGTYGGFTYHLSTLFERFLEAPVLTSMKVSTLSFQFPDVYICPTSTVTMSMAVEQLPSYQIYTMENYPNVAIDTKITLYNFDLASGRYKDASTPALALVNVLQSTEAALMAELQFPDTEGCRTTVSGEEYAGNASSATIYQLNKMLLQSDNISAIKLPPVRTHVQCMKWNDAARKLHNKGGGSLADRLLSLNFSDGESRCRSPPGLPLSEFFPIANRPLLKLIGCYVANSTGSEFNFTCDTGGLMSHETCAGCCSPLGYSHIGLQVGSCICGSSPPSSVNSSDICSSKCHSNSKQACGSDTAVTVLQIRETEPKPLQIGNFSNLTVFSNGPYCFFTDELDRLNAGFCDIPFCPTSSAYDCIVSSEDETVQKQQRAKYTGRKNVTVSGKRCLPWSQLKGDLSRRYSYGPFKFLDLQIQTPDYAENGGENFCRSVEIVYDGSDSLTFESKSISRFQMVFADTPVCAVRTGTLSVMAKIDIEPCDIPFCYSTIPSVTGAVRDTVGSHLLARQFGSDLSVSLADCSFAGQKCTKKNFVNVVHPQLGMCHQFLKQQFTANMTSTQQAQSQLTIKYFTDATDSKGQTVANIDKLTGVVHSSQSSDANRMAFKAIIVPESAFPWPSKGIDVAASQRMDVQLRLDKFSRLSVVSRPCVETIKPIAYRMPYWNQADSNEDLDSTSRLKQIVEAPDWMQKLAEFERMLGELNSSRALIGIDRLFNFPDMEDCINTYVVQMFMDNCKCLPSFLPIRVEFFLQYDYCFDSKNTEIVSLATELCYREQASKLLQHQFDAVSQCKSPCSTADYSARHITYPWPNLNSMQSLPFLKSLATAFGYGDRPSGLRGLDSIYCAYLRSLNATLTPASKRNPLDILSFDSELTVLQNRLAHLTIQAWTSYGQEVSEEEAYPAKNLLADIGGALGLWSGISILTACELLELLLYFGLALGARIRACQASASGEPRRNSSSGSSLPTVRPHDVELQVDADSKL